MFLNINLFETSTPVLLPGKSHGRGSLVGCSPWGPKESDTTEQLHFHFSLSCIGKGNGNPLQCCCLENPRDRGAWWASIYGVTQSRTRLMRHCSSSSRNNTIQNILKCEKLKRVKSHFNSYCSFAIDDKCYAHSYAIRSIIKYF